MKLWEIGKLLHGGNYNVDQWLDHPDILAEDIRLMKLAGVNVVSLCIFSWSSLEPEEGVYTFEWLDEVMDSMYKNGIYVILATPSAGKPPWLIKKYPDIMRTREHRQRLLYGERENHCNSNKIFREKVCRIDEKLAERYANHPALILWHISNEMYGICHCETCQASFRKWLQGKYKTIDCLNEQYWSNFWSHRYTDWEELESPSSVGETAVHGLALDYKRFYSDLSIDFLQMEIDAVKKYNPSIPVTTNLFHFNCGIDCWKVSEILDVISFDKYPHWHNGADKTSEWAVGVESAFAYDYCRSMQNKPFLLMESSPSSTNWMPVAKLKRPGIHMLGSMQAIAGGADSVQYFQWRQSRGAFEKFHGAVVTHNGSEHTRVFQDVTQVGARLADLAHIKNTETKARVAIIFDWDNLRGLDEQKSLRNVNRDFEQVIMEHYEAVIQNYVSVDVIAQTADFSRYKVIIAPMLYMFLPGTADQIRIFIKNGVTLIITFYSGMVNENDLAFECFPPFALNDVFGIKAEETDSLEDSDENSFNWEGKTYKVKRYCDLVQLYGAEVMAVYEQDFYAGLPVLTKNEYGSGMAYYMAARSDVDFLRDFYARVLCDTEISQIVKSEYVKDVMVKERCDKEKQYVFLMNFSRDSREICGETLKGYEVKILEKYL